MAEARIEKTEGTDMTEISGIQVIECDQRGDRFVFWCDHCNQEHIHSAAEGHRVAHCHDRQGPYHGRGYILKLRQGPKPEQDDFKPLDEELTRESAYACVIDTLRGVGGDDYHGWLEVIESVRRDLIYIVNEETRQ